eukprot:UN24380
MFSALVSACQKLNPYCLSFFKLAKNRMCVFLFFKA